MEQLYHFSAPGRTEISGNHTDHQHGRVLAAGVDLDVIAAACPNDEGIIRIKSEGYPEDVIDLRELAEGREITRVIVDPSAASFIEALRREGFRVVRADNDVADGIRVTADLLRQRRIVLCDTCRDCLREMALYCWDERTGRDAPRKEHDHAMDEMRYFAMDLMGERSGGFAVTSVRRQA